MNPLLGIPSILSINGCKWKKAKADSKKFSFFKKKKDLSIQTQPTPISAPNKKWFIDANCLDLFLHRYHHGKQIFLIYSRPHPDPFRDAHNVTFEIRTRTKYQNCKVKKWNQKYDQMKRRWKPQTQFIRSNTAGIENMCTSFTIHIISNECLMLGAYILRIVPL